MQENLKLFIEWAKKNNWDVVQNHKGEYTLPKEVTDRYTLPDDFVFWLANMRKAVSPEGSAWFLLEDDFKPSKDYLMHWNELELLGTHLANDDGDLLLSQQITEFWEKVIPIFMSAGEGYAFFGIDTSRNNAIIMGQEPFFHLDTKVIAKDLSELLLLFTQDEIELAE